MNIRIQELIVQATESPVFPANIGYFNPEKFAELLIRECAELVTKEYNNRSALHGDDLLKHFGVLE